MGQSRFRAYRAWMVVALVFSGTLAAIGLHPASADVSAVKGSAFGFSTSISLFGGPAAARGPAPAVTLPAAGSGTPVTGTAPSSNAQYGPATIFTSDQADVSTQGTTGAGGTVTTSTRLANLNKSGQEVFTAASVTSTCTATESAKSGSTTITSGTLRTSEGDPNVDGDDTTVTVPTNPAPNTTITGTIEAVGDSFRYVFNEQIMNADGSITVNAAHQYLLGPTAVGDLIIGQSVCGVTATGSTTTTAPGATTTTTAPGATTTTQAVTTTTAAPTTTTTAPPPTTTTAPATTTTAPAGGTSAGVGGGAYGFFVSVGLFGGPAATRGPVPTVSLPSAGSATPVTATAPTGSGVFGPATIFSSGQLDVSTEGTPGGTVTSSSKIADVNKSGQEVFTAASLTGKCTASPTGVTGSVSITGGKLITSEVNPDIDEDDIVVPLPADPAPNTVYKGKIETVGDEFQYTFNEQIKEADGSIIVNAAHMKLLGPTAVGELIIGQSRCSRTAGGASTSGGGGSGSGGGLVSTGLQAARLVGLAMALLSVGWGATVSTDGAQPTEPRRRRRPMPWDKSGFLR